MVIRGVLVVLVTIISCAETNQPSDLGAGGDDDDVSSLLKAFDDGYDNSVKGLYAKTVDDLKSPAQAWSSAHEVQTADRAYEHYAAQNSGLNDIEDDLDERSREEELGESTHAKPHHHKPKEKDASEADTDRDLGESGTLGDGDDSQSSYDKLVQTPAGAENPDDEMSAQDDTKLDSGVKKQTISLPIHDGWSTVKQYNHFQLRDKLSGDDMKSLGTWMSKMRQENQMPGHDLGEGVEYRDEDLSYGHGLGHWRQEYVQQKKEQANQENNANKAEKRDSAFMTITEYMHVHHINMAQHDTTKLEKYMVRSGVPQGTPELGESQAASSENSAAVFRAADIEYAYQAHEWDGGNSKFDTISHFVGNKHMKFSLHEQQKIASWMKLQNMASQQEDLGESTSATPSAKNTKTNIDEVQKAYIQNAMRTQWRVADIEYALQAGQWKKVIF